jgi:hypothetical protein
MQHAVTPYPRCRTIRASRAPVRLATNAAYLEEACSPAYITSIIVHNRKLARVMRVTSTNRSPALLSRTQFRFNPSHRTHDTIWTEWEWPAPVELEYVPAMHTIHADNPAESPRGQPHRIRAAVSAFNVAATRHASCPARRLANASPSLACILALSHTRARTGHAHDQSQPLSCSYSLS